MSEIFYNNFTGGVNNTSAPDNLKNNQLTRCVNSDPFQDGGIKSRSGCVKNNNTSFGKDCNQEIEWIFSDGSTATLRMIDKDLYLCDDATDTKVLKRTMASNTISCVQYKDKLYILDGVSYLVWGEYNFFADVTNAVINTNLVVKNIPKSSGSGVKGHFYKSKISGTIDLTKENFADTSKWSDITIGTAMCDNLIDVVAYNDDSQGTGLYPSAQNNLIPIKRCKYICLHEQSMRFFCSGDAEDQIAVYYSEINHPDYFGKTSIVYPTTSSGEVRGLVNFYQQLLVGYKLRWRVWDGITPFDSTSGATWFDLPIPFGLASNDTIAYTPESLTFQDNTGHIQILSPSILPTANVVTLPNSSNIYNATIKLVNNTITAMKNISGNKGVYHSITNKYYLSYSMDGVNYDNVLVMDFNYKAFYNITGWEVHGWCIKSDGSLNFASKNYSIKCFVGNNDINVDTGNYKAIEPDIESKAYDLDYYMGKRIDKVYITTQQDDLITDSFLNVEISTDYTNTILVLDNHESMTYGRIWGKIWGWSDVTHSNGEVNKSCYRVKLRITAKNLDNPFFIYSIGFKFEIINIDTYPVTSRKKLSEPI